MSLTSTLSTALSGLAVAQRALSITAANVANVNTEGYARKTVRQEALIVDGRGAGARITAIERVVDTFLSGELRVQEAALGRSAALAEAMAGLGQSLFGAPGDAARGLPNRLQAVARAAESWAGSPDKGAARVALVGVVEDALAGLAADAATIQARRRDLDQEIKQTVDSVNADIAALSGLNADFARGEPSPDLLDRRDGLLAGLAQKLDVTIVRRPNETVSIYLENGQPLLEYSPRMLHYAPTSAVSETTPFGPIRLYHASDIDPATGLPDPAAASTVVVSGGVRAQLSPELMADAVPDADQTIVSALTGGRLAGLLEARDRAHPELADQLSELAGALRFQLNKAHNEAAAVPPPTSLSGTRTDLAGFAASPRVGTAYLAVVDRVSGVTQATIPVDLAAAADAAALAAQINAGLGALGTAAIGPSGGLEITTANPAHGLAVAEGTSAVTVTDAAGHTRNFGFSHYFGLNDLVVATGAASTDLALRADIRADPSRLSAARLDVATAPALTATLGGTGDNRGAQGLAAALAERVGMVTRGGLAAGSFNVRDYAAEIVAVHAVRTGQAEEDAERGAVLVEDLTFRQAAVSGVNLDEEMARLVLYQQAYSVSARVITVTEEMFDVLLGIGR